MSHDFGELLEIKRRKARLTQRALGKRCGMSHRTIGSLEQGLRQPTARIVIALLTVPVLGLQAITTG